MLETSTDFNCIPGSSHRWNNYVNPQNSVCNHVGKKQKTGAPSVGLSTPFLEKFLSQIDPTNLFMSVDFSSIGWIGSFVVILPCIIYCTLFVPFVRFVIIKSNLNILRVSSSFSGGRSVLQISQRERIEKRKSKWRWNGPRQMIFSFHKVTQ